MPALSGSLRLRGGQYAETSTAEIAKRFLAAGEHDDLQIAGLARQRIKHPLDPVVVRVDDGVVEDDGRGRARLGQHACEGETDEQRDLLLRTARQDIEVLLRARPHQGRGQQGLWIEAEFRLWPEQPQERNEFRHHGFDIAVPRRRSGFLQRRAEFLQDRDFELQTCERSLDGFKSDVDVG